jgi:hypothetical protein
MMINLSASSKIYMPKKKDNTTYRKGGNLITLGKTKTKPTSTKYNTIYKTINTHNS